MPPREGVPVVVVLVVVSLSDELELSSVLGDTRAYLYSPVWG